MKKKIAAAVVAVLIVLLAFPVSAWFGNQIAVQNSPAISGSTGAAFFAGGDGSVDNPYQISDAVHLYNMAWLQYIGYFNLRDGYNNGRAQSYFILTADITIPEGFTALPPIGTTQYPFHGNFDGNNKVITGLTTANLHINDLENNGGLITEAPDTAQFLDSGLLKTYVDASTEAGQVMGFFGVIGDYNDSVQAIDNVTVTSGGETHDYSVNTTGAPEVGEDDGMEVSHEDNVYILYTQEITAKNFALANYTVQTDSAATTVGLAAGYVNAKLESIGVASGTVNVKNATGAADTNLTANVSDYTLVGYCTEAFQVENDHEVTVYEPGNDFTLQEIPGGGELGEAGAGMGGSMDMVLLNKRLTYMYTENLRRLLGASNLELYDLAMPNTSTTFNFYQYNYRMDFSSTSYLDGYLGSGTYLPLNINESVMFPTGYTQRDYTPSGSYTFHYNDKYAELTKETLSSVEINNTTYYTNTGYIVGGGSGTGTWVRARVYPIANGNNAGIFRSLGTEKTANASITRAGMQLLTLTRDGTPCVLIDEYNKNASTDVANLTKSSAEALQLTKYEDSIQDEEVVKGVVSKFVDSYTTSQTTMLHGVQFWPGVAKGIVVDEDGNFTDTTVKTMVEDVNIGNTLYTEYQMINGAINFNLQQTGVLTTIAGTYAAAYNEDAETDDKHSLFAIFKVERTQNATGQWIIDNDASFWIESVWVNNGNDNKRGTTDDLIEYNLVDLADTLDANGNVVGTYSGDYTTTYNGVLYECVYNVHEMNSLPIQAAAYYFEIPLTAGDYALGARQGDVQGAFHLYLDIGANAGAGEGEGTTGKLATTTTTEYMDITINVKNYSDGVEILQTAERDTDGSLVFPEHKDFARVLIPGFKTSITLTRTADGIQVALGDSAHSQYVLADPIVGTSKVEIQIRRSTIDIYGDPNEDGEQSVTATYRFTRVSVEGSTDPPEIVVERRLQNETNFTVMTSGYTNATDYTTTSVTGVPAATVTWADIKADSRGTVVVFGCNTTATDAGEYSWSYTETNGTKTYAFKMASDITYVDVTTAPAAGYTVTFNGVDAGEADADGNLSLPSAP